MEVTKLIILLCCASLSLSSDEHHSHTIPVEGYETELQDLGQHVEIPETPVKVIKITKTIAVKIPVPYPVKVIEKVPYPVHVNKPYPVPVPHIVKVPHSEESNNLQHGQEALDIAHINPYNQNQINANSYKVQEASSQGSHVNDGHYDGPVNHEGSYGPNDGYYSDSHDQEGYNSNLAIQHNSNNFNPISNYAGEGGYQKF